MSAQVQSSVLQQKEQDKLKTSCRLRGMVATEWLAPLVKTLATQSSHGPLAGKGSAEIFGRPCGNSMELAFGAGS